FDIMLHVPNEQRLVRRQPMVFWYLMDLPPLVPYLDIGLVQVAIETRHGSLDGKMVAMNRAQQECAQLALPAKLEELPRMRQLAHRILHFTEMGMEPFLQLRQRNVRHVPLIKERE